MRISCDDDCRLDEEALLKGGLAADQNLMVVIIFGIVNAAFDALEGGAVNDCREKGVKLERRAQL